MNELIRINYETEQPTVSARDLHEALEVGTRFNDWFSRMVEYGFEEGKDFYSKMSKTTEAGGRPSTDYDLSIRAAKEICMIQRTETGRTIRKYFLDLEDAWNSPEQIMARALQMANDTIFSLKDRCRFLGGQVVEQQRVIEELQPKASYYDLILQCKDLIATTVIAKDYGMSAKAFNKMLHEMGVQFKQGDTWVLYAKYQGQGYLKVKTHNYSDTDGVQHSREHSYWTQKGRLFLYGELKQRGLIPVIEREAA